MLHISVITVFLLQCLDTDSWVTGWYLAYKKSFCCFVGGDDLTGSLNIIQLVLSSNKMQTGDILILANRGPRGKMAVKTE